MNLVGKILVVALLVMSLVFGSFTLAVHATHKNWKLMVDNTDAQKGPPGLKQIIAERDARITQKTTELAEKEQLYVRTLREAEQRLGQLESYGSELKKQRDALQGEIALKSSELTDAIKGANDSATVLAKTQVENKALRDENTQVKMERDQHYDQLVKLIDQHAQAAGEWARLQERNRQLLAQCAQYRLVLQDNNLPTNLEIPTVFGLVTDTNTAAKMVQINLGSDQGLKKGIEMLVYRFGDNLATTSYLGKIRLSTVDKTAAVGQVVELKGTIQKDDHVATRIE